MGSPVTQSLQKHPSTRIACSPQSLDPHWIQSHYAADGATIAPVPCQQSLQALLSRRCVVPAITDFCGHMVRRVGLVMVAAVYLLRDRWSVSGAASAITICVMRAAMSEHQRLDNLHCSSVVSCLLELHAKIPLLRLAPARAVCTYHLTVMQAACRRQLLVLVPLLQLPLPLHGYGLPQEDLALVGPCQMQRLRLGEGWDGDPKLLLLLAICGQFRTMLRTICPTKFETCRCVWSVRGIAVHP